MRWFFLGVLQKHSRLAGDDREEQRGGARGKQGEKAVIDYRRSREKSVMLEFPSICDKIDDVFAPAKKSTDVTGGE